MAKSPRAVQEAARLAEEIHAREYSVDEDPAVPFEGQEPDPGVAAEAPVEPTVAAEPARDAAYWEQRFKTIQGKYDTEIPNLIAQVRTADANRMEYARRLQDLERQLAERAVQEPAVTPKKDLVTEKEREEYGPEFTDFILRIATEAAKDQPTRNQPAASQTPEPAVRQQQQYPNPRDVVLSSLDAVMPNWREINKSPDFLLWLGKADPLSGANRHQLLMGAFESGDANRVRKFFDQFVGENQAADAPPAKVSLEQLAGPQTAGLTAQPQQRTQERVWTGAEIAEFYRDVSGGKYRANESEKLRIEASLGKALKEGKVSPG